MTTCCTPPPASAKDTAVPTQAPQYRKPRYAVDGTDEAATVTIELPGVTKDGVRLDFEKGILTVEGNRTVKAPEAWKPLHRELSDVGYMLRLRLNTLVDEDNVTANLADGVLTVTLPVKAAAKPRRIEIN